jgi:hypothetical protein
VKIQQWFVGFHAPYWRNENGRIDPRGWFGHIELWGFTRDETWLFLDPAGAGSVVVITHRHDEVLGMLEIKNEVCETILRVNPVEPHFRLPLHGLMTCAAISGHLLGCRALFPASLRRKLLANGAEVIHARQTATVGGG